MNSKRNDKRGVPGAPLKEKVAVMTDNIVEQSGMLDGEDDVILRRKKEPVKKTGITAEGLVKTAADALAQLRSKKPLVQCLTNYVAANFSANALLALGASPAMVDDMGEATQFAKIADSLLVNVGTVTKSQGEAMRAAVSHANMSSHPWILDPVAVGVLSARTFIAKELMRRFPAVIRGNASEILFLAGAETGGRGVDSVVSSDEAVLSAARLSGVTHAAVLVTGETDYVTAEGAPVVVIKNGTPLLTRITGAGCVQGAVCAAFLGTLGGKARYEAAAASALVIAIAGEMAAEKATAPGSFHAAFIDALDAITPQEIVKRAKLSLAEADSFN